ncbi:MAG: hypothetical protein EOO41_04755 [Methanobacteriota archaeon]|nr:MAG: hypothetical protein EOO41_04755 [Euryarchaeota archaeon]
MDAAQPLPYWDDGASLEIVYDPEALLQDNPAEEKYRKLARSLMRSVIDPNLKPDRTEMAIIQTAVAAPTLDTRLDLNEKELLWKFRYILTGNKKALTKVCATPCAIRVP